MQHYAHFVWMHLGLVGEILVPEIGENVIIKHQLRVWKLAEPELASF